MKPIYLKMSAFGSYARETVIDFRKVNQGIFLITGDTGSGKTTIFDGITYALYGQTSGGRRDGAMMRSQYAELTTKTFVELEFESKGQIYRVIRNPEYERESKRKNKDGERTTTKEKAGVELYLPDGSLYRGNRQEVNRKLVEILGVDARQFTQIVMIAQGDFLRLLLAKSDERKEIFSKIFDTKIFRKVQEELKNRAKQLYISLEDNKKACQREIEQMEGKLELGENENLDNVIEAAKGLTEVDQKTYGELQNQGKQSTRKLENQNRIYSLAKEMAARYQELEKVQTEWNKLECEKEQWDQKRVLLEWGRKSQMVQPVEQAFLQTEKNLQDTWDRIEKLQKWFTVHGQDRYNKEQQLEKCKNFQKKLEEKEVPVLNRLRQSLEQYRGLQERLKSTVILEKQCKVCQDSYQAAENCYLKLAADYEEMYQAYFREQAGILAAGLKEGTPCPVCGSLEHPQKAILSSQAPDRELVEKMKKNRDLAEQKRGEEQKKLLEISGKMEREMAIIREMERQLLGEEQKDSSLEEIRKRWEDWEKKAKERLLKGQKQIDETAKKLEECSRSFQKAVQEESQKKGQQEENEKLLKVQTELMEKARKKFVQTVENQGFSSKEHYRQCRMDKREMERLERELTTFEKRKTETKQKKAILEKQLEGKEKPELERISQELEQLRTDQKKLEKELRQAYSRREKNREAYRKLCSLAEERKNLRSQYEKVGNISRTANGNLSGSVKIDFESYMQRQYFEQMITCANHHLQKMASGQFLLRCRSLENLSTQGSAGLDLDVYSMVTGKERDVKTLSGGESFMAALALALGMTDVITRTTGAVRMDTLFIDEGFGSLDENSREQAIRILQGLAGGKRLVGIISHVTELKDQIEQQLVVTKNRTGSQASWNKDLA